MEKLKIRNPNFYIHSSNDDLDLTDLTKNEKSLLNGTLKNKNILETALLELKKSEPNHEKVGNLLSQHHTILRDILNVSTPKIEIMMDAALNAGALGGKINGSGGGGCMFAYAPNDPKHVAEAIEKVGGKVYVIQADEGTRIE
jgi:galactokinase